MTSAVLGALTQFNLGSGASPQVYTKVAEVTSIGPIGSTAPEVDVTNLDSTAMEYISGLPDGNAIDVVMNFLSGNTQQEAMRDGVGSTFNVQIIWPDSPNTTAVFSFVLLGFNRDETTPTDALKASVTGRITGAIVWT